MARTRARRQAESVMVFNSLGFVAFFAIVLGVNALPLPWTWRKVNLLIASYVFYSAWIRRS
jgi:alginate O-acetyltransferase complex protein AlgI